MFNFLFKSGKVQPDLSFIGVDMHSHLLPNLDDGLTSPEQTIRFLIHLKELGYKKLICTPHILSDLYPNSKTTILPKLELIRNLIQKENIDIQIEAAAEYMMDHDFSVLVSKSKKEDLLTIGKKYILVEMSYFAASPNVEQILFDLRMLGLQPILAHPERYSYYHRNFSEYERFKDLGCKFQVNLLSISGGYGPEVKKVAEILFQKNMVDFVGTDMHHEKHLMMLKELATQSSFYRLLNKAKLLNSTL